MGGDLGMEELEGMDRQVHRAWAEGQEAAKELRLMGARDPRIRRYMGSGVPGLNQPMDIDWHSNELLGLSGDRAPGFRQEKAGMLNWEPCQVPSPSTVS